MVFSFALVQPIVPHTAVVKDAVKREMPWDKLGIKHLHVMLYMPITAICFLHIKLFEHIHIYTLHKYIHTYIHTYAYIYTHTRMVVARHFGTVIPSSGKHVKYILAMP